MAQKKLSDCPTNVKEALEWLAQLATNTDGCAYVISEIFSQFHDANGLVDQVCKTAEGFVNIIMKKNGGYKSAYDGALWNKLCKNSGGKKCCQLTGGSGCENCNASSSTCDGCCAKCPQQICARIFCLIVPVLIRVLGQLLVKCRSKEDNGGWGKQQLNGNGTSGKTDLKDFMLRCGFKSDELADNKKGEDLTKNNGGLTTLVGALTEMYEALEKALQSNQYNPQQQFLKDANSNNKPAPSSLTDLLLWLQFLPYCSNYSEVLKQVKKQLNSNGNENIVTHLNDAISHLPMLFLQIEGPGKRNDSSPAQGSSLFLKISELSKCQYIFHEKYYNDPQTVAKMLLCVFPVIHWGLKALKDRCNDSNCSSTLTACESTKKLLQSLGWNGSKDSTDTNELKPIIHENAKCQPLKDYLDKYLLGNSSALAGMKKILEGAWQRENGPTGFNNNGSYLPRTIYEMLIWLMGLPVSDKFKDLKKEKNGDISAALEPLTQILFEVPNLFLTLNGDLSGMLGELFKCNGIDNKGPAYQYGSDGQSCLGIFSAIVAILYPVIRYLQQRCKGDAQAFANGDSWQSKNTNAAPLSEFLKFMGFGSTIASSTAVSGSEFHTGVLTPIFGDLTQNGGKSTEKLKTLYDCAKAALKKNSNTGSHTPSTIRQMMLWLIGLPVTKEYGDNGTGLINTVTTKAQQINDLKNKITNGQPESLHYQLQHSIVGMMTAISQIEGGLGSVVEFLKDGFKVDNTHHLQYQSGEQLFTQFTTYVTSVHVQLRFLMVMCNTEKENGGWSECHYAMRSYSSSSGVTGTILCKCHSGGEVACGKEPLRRFLTNNGNNNGQNKNKFILMNDKQTEHYQMGFSDFSSTTPAASGSLPTLTGKDIYTYLKDLIDEINTTQNTSQSSKPLSLLTQYCVAMGPVEPQSLGELFAFFLKLGTEWDNLKLYGRNVETFKDKLEKELKEYKIGQNGDQKQACDELKTAITAILPTTHSEHNDKRDLMSLMCTSTSGSNSCTPYMKSLSQGVYHYYLPDVKQPGDTDKFGVFQYLYDMLRKLLDGMKQLQNAFNECDCCKKGSSNCQGLIQCPNAHPILYKFGFVFGNPGSLKSSPKKCDTLKGQLDKVLSCEHNKESALFSAFECLIQVTYKVLLDKAKGKVTGYNWNGKVTSADDTKKAFENYVHNAMYDSYPKLICTFACKVFDSGHNCNDDCKTRFKDKAPESALKELYSSTTSSPITVSSTAVTSITAVIPQYTAPVIDPYHYRMLKKSHTESKEKITQDNKYVFSDAIDFHVKGAQCIRPAPVALRSVIDWILRVTTGAIATQGGNTNTNSSNGNISKLSGAIKEVFNTAGVGVDDVQQNVIDLVQGLRKFVGYEDRSGDVISKVGEALGNGTNGNGVKKLLEDKIKSIDDYLKKKNQFGTELGKALLKGRYECKHSLFSEVMRTISAVVGVVTGYKKDAEPKTFKDVIKTFSEILSSTHAGCNELNCKSINNSDAAAAQSGEQKTGLKLLEDLFTELQKFAALWTRIGKSNGGQGASGSRGTSPSQGPSSCLVRHCCIDAEAEIYCELKNKIDPFVTSYFSRLQMHIYGLGKCATQVLALEKPNGVVTDSTAYRAKITQLIKELKEALEYLKGIPLDYVVDGSNKLLQITKGKVDIAIPYSIKTAIVENAYGKHACSNSSGHPRHQNMSGVLCIETLIKAIETAINSKCETYHSHLDDLKQLCQWLYRMGQLYAHGLKGFVESLIEHLKHIIQVICWIEGIQKMMTKLKEINKESEALQVTDLNGLSPCCKKNDHQSLYNGSNKFSTRDDFFTALNCRIDHLLTSYVLGQLPDGSKDKEQDKQEVQERRQLLSEIRLLALDRYTLQVWQDECNPNGGRPSTIKNWITFENGIVKRSNLGDIKQKLSDLTGIPYSSNTTTVASPPATPSASHRIHNFHAICVIQKFSYEAPIARLERSLEKLNEIQGQLSAVKEKCNENKQDVSSDTVVTSFCDSVSQFLSEPYGIFSFAKFVHTILGPNVFSAVIGALEELKDKEKYKPKTQNGGNLDKIRGILEVLVDGNTMDSERQNDYKLSTIITKLNNFITTLRREYIFSYPVVTCTAQTKAVATPQSQPLVPASDHGATGSISKLQGVTPPCPSSFHTASSVCELCYPHLAKIFIACVPLLYPQLCFLCYQGQHFWSQHLTKDDTKPLCSLLGTYGWQKECMEKYAYIDVPFCGHHVSWLLNKESDSLELLDSTVPDTLKSHDSPLNKDSPLRKLYDLCIQYYQRNAEEARQKRLEDYRQQLADELRKNGQSAELNNITLPLRRPRTLREILRWMSHLQFWCNLHDLEDRLKQRCMQSGVVYGSQLWNVLLATSAMSAIFSQLIEQPGEGYLEFFSEIYTNSDDYVFISRMDEMFYMFSELLVELYRGLKFMCLQCSLDSSKGGWRNCHVTAAATAAVTPTRHLCNCPQRSQTTQNAAGAAQNCPRPLHAYLTDDLLCAKDHLGDCVCKTMAHRGWKQALKERKNSVDKKNSALTAITGDMIFQFLKNFVGHSADARPLLSLTRVMITISIRPPDSMTGYFSFLYQFGRVFLTVASMDARQKSLEAANPKTKPWSKKTYWHNVKERFDKEIELCPGRYHPKDMTDALMALVDYSKGHDTAVPQVSEEHEIGDLSAISFCPVLWINQGNQRRYMQCGGFILPLEMSLYGLWSPRYCRQYLSWVLHFGPKLYTDIENMRKEFELQENGMKHTTSPSFATCTIVLPLLHKSGFHLYSPKFPTKDKKCVDFVKALDKLLHCQSGCVSALCLLLRAIEAFLWSIRLPFSLVQLSLWSFAVLFISYVFVVPLDHFKIKSHLFNRLKYTMHPSLLIADQQRRVSEVAYFSL